MAHVARALGDPVRVQLVDVLRKHAVSHHLTVLREARILGSERQGLWAYYFVIPTR
ncbi:MAG: hypothetical protein M3071_23115 [Actinomycetota bacterium]|nr:hypothetical protein [Actinomycetota bacterium]